MTSILVVVPSGGMEDTGAIGGAFRLHAQVPAQQQLDPFGNLVVVEAGPQQPAVIGMSASSIASAPVWHLGVVYPPNGPLLRNAKSKDLFSLMAGLPDCVLLVEPGMV